MTIYLGLPRLLISVTLCPEVSSSSWIWWWLVSCPWPCFPSTDVGETSASTCGLSNFPLTLHRSEQTKQNEAFSLSFFTLADENKGVKETTDERESSESCYSICTYIFSKQKRNFPHFRKHRRRNVKRTS